VPALERAEERRARERLRKQATPDRLAVGAVTLALGAFLATRLGAWPPNEDETLVFFLASQPLGELLDTVAGERGGAPLHFLLAHFVLLASPTLEALRLLSAVPVVLSLPVVAALARRLAGRRAALVAVVLVAASSVTHFQGVYARMYGLFLLTTALSFLLLLRAVERPSAKRWLVWGLAALAALAAQPYGALVLMIQAAYVLWLGRRDRRSLLRPALAFGLVALAAVPLWITYSRLASRFDVGAGPGGSALGSPGEVLAYLWETLGDFTAGWLPATISIALAALAGLLLLARRRRDAALLTGLVVGLPAAALLLSRSSDGLFLETRHLVFALPFVVTALAVAILEAARVAGRAGPLVAAAALAVLVALQVGWGVSRTPWLYSGEPQTRETARVEAAEWLAASARPDDVLFGYEPTYLDARREGAPYGEIVVPRADPVLALDELRNAEPGLGRGVWVLDASDFVQPEFVELTIPERSPGAAFEARAFGPFLVVRTREPTRTSERFLDATSQVQRLGIALGIADARLNLATAEEALRLAGSF
jgi:Dolichyl-phosphate-mannose-protein mannosyltransferase